MYLLIYKFIFVCIVLLWMFFCLRHLYCLLFNNNYKLLEQHIFNNNYHRKGNRKATKFIAFTFLVKSTSIFSTYTNSTYSNYPKKLEIQKIQVQRREWKSSIVNFIFHKIIYHGKNIIMQGMRCIHKPFASDIHATTNLLGILITENHIIWWKSYQFIVIV